MRNIPGSNTNKCSHVGFHKLNSHTDHVWFDTRNDQNNYVDNRKCYWAYWGPGKYAAHLYRGTLVGGIIRLVT